MANISQSFTYKMAAKATGIDMKQNYVTVTLCIYQLSRLSPGLTHSTVSVYSLRQIQGPICCSRLLHRSFTLTDSRKYKSRSRNELRRYNATAETDCRRGREYCKERVCLSLCVFVCPWLSSELSSDLHHILWMLHMAEARSFPGGAVIHYVLHVLWMTSCFAHRPRLLDVAAQL